MRFILVSGNSLKASISALCLSVLLASIGFSGISAQAEPAKAKKTSIEGYVYDSACYYTRDLDKPISHACAVACAKSGSPLVIVSKEGIIYLPVDKEMPARGQNDKLLPFGGMLVKASGYVYERGGSYAMVIESVEEVKANQK